MFMRGKPEMKFIISLTGRFTGKKSRVKFPPVLFLAVTVSFAVAPSYQIPFDIHAGGEPISVYYAPAVCVEDWDGDGLRDLIIGHCNQNWDGTIDLYINSGTPDSPVFTYLTEMQADGDIIQLDHGG